MKVLSYEKIMKLIRKLARSNYYQTIYTQEKNLGLKLFKNERDLTMLQINFLNYLGFYSNLYLDAAVGEIDAKIIEDDIYSDAYMYYKHKVENKERFNKFQNLNNIRNLKDNNVAVRSSQWIFKRPIKRVK